MATSNLGALRTHALALAVAAALAAHTVRAQEPAQEQEDEVPQDQGQEPALNPDGSPAGVEEFMVVGRLRSAAESLTLERMSTPFSADFLGSEVISRAGDSDIAAALRRVPGLTLIDGQFVYVRGLGERYSSVLVNGAAVPSPELTRSVIPLDLFPTSIVDSIKIQKAPSPDATAAFGGGMVDIRTTSVPQAMIAQFSLGLGYNSLSDEDGLTYPGEGTPLPDPIREAIGTYRGDITVTNILNTLRATAPATISDARVIHQGLIDSLNTNIALDSESLDPDMDAKIALGNAWDLGDSWTFGVLFNGNYNDKYRNEDQTREGIGNPDSNFVVIDKTVYEERTVGALNLGLSYLEDHAIELNAYKLTNDEDEASIARGYDSNRQFPEQKVSYTTRLEERELEILQISGEHTFVDTPFFTNLLDKVGMEDLEFDWFYSESSATTDVPNETRFQAYALLDATTGQELSTQILATTTAGQFGFLDLDDDMESWGGNLRLPLGLERIGLALSAGWWGSKKSRSYEQYLVNLNSVGVQSSVLAGDTGDVLQPGNLTVDNGFDLTVGSQFGTESYIAGQKVDAGYGMVDIDIESWRFTVGGRWETYQQAVLPIDLLDYTGVSILALQTALLDPDQRLAVEEDDVYSSLAVTFASTGALGADDYQVRFSYGETVVRPDLREIADVVFLDPQLDVRIQGNPSLLPSPIDNFEIRSEFYYGGGDNFTVSLFYKDIQSPIDQVRLAGSDDDFVIGFANAESGEVSGIELEGLKMLPAGLFIAGNATLSDSEIQFDPALATDLTNQTRRLAGHSEWVINTTLGYDSENGKHSAFLNYNAFGERIFFAGTGNNDDAYELPFHSVGIVYKYFPTDRLQLEFKLDNILDEEREFEQVSANGDTAKVLTQEVGTNFGLSARWSF
jgi:outer membrane receptor protein involved in Fe transport